MSTPATTNPAAAGPVDEAPRYTFVNSFERGQQLQILADIQDATTTSVLARTGVTAGWKVLEAGAGGCTVAEWLAKQVGPDGHVTALDLQPRPLHHLPPNVTVQAGDIRTVDLPPDEVDLVFARQFLLHIPDREKVLARMVSWLKPGGWIVIIDWAAVHHDWLLHTRTREAADAFHAVHDALLSILESNGADLDWAPRVPFVMREAGLVDIETTVHRRLWAGGEPGALLHVSNSHQLDTQLRARGVTAAQLDLFRTSMLDPESLVYGYLAYTTVARRPEK